MTDMTDDQVRALLDGATENAYDLAVVKWGGGIRCVYLNDYRVAGEKPWGGGDTTRRFKVRMADIMQAFRGTVQAAAPDLARALLATRAELARVKADAAVAVALMVERAATQADPWDGPVTKNKIVDAQAIAAQQIKARIRALAPADGLAAVDALRVEARENAMQALASMGQAQEAYEAQLEAEAELARVKADAALAQTPTDPGDGWTWNERLGWIGPDGKPADPRRRG